MKMKLKGWVKVVAYFILVIITLLWIISLFTKKTVVITEGKNYTCYGVIIEVCSGITYDYE